MPSRRRRRLPGVRRPRHPPRISSQLVGPIALYPDDLVAIILPASTNPLQLVQADRFLDKRKADPKLPVDDKWDDAVKSLLNYPDVVKMMSADLDWTSALGEAVVADQGAVLEAIQSFRRRAQAAGNLKSDAKQVVKVEKEIIIIVPADPQVIYVPQYNPATVVVVRRGAGLRLLPDALPVVLLPVCARRGARRGRHLGRGDRRGLERQPLRLLRRNTNINVNRNTNINTGNINTRQRRRGGSRAGGGTRVEVQQAARPGQQLRRQDRASARAGDARGGAGGERRRRAVAGRGASTQAAGGGMRRRRRRRARQAATPSAATARGGRPRWTVPVAPRAAARWPAPVRRGAFDAERRRFAFAAEWRRCACRRRWRRCAAAVAAAAAAAAAAVVDGRSIAHAPIPFQSKARHHP